MGIAGLVLGIVAIVGVFIPYVNFVAWLLAVVGIVLSALAMSKAKRENTSVGAAIAGLVLSIIAVVVTVPVAICVIRLYCAAEALATDILRMF